MVRLVNEYVTYYHISYMFIYYSSVLICFIATFFKDKKIKLFILVGLMIFLCAGYMCGTGNETGQNHGQTDIFHFVGIGGGDMDRSSVHTGFYIHYVSDR